MDKELGVSELRCMSKELENSSVLDLLIASLIGLKSGRNFEMGSCQSVHLAVRNGNPNGTR